MPAATSIATTAIVITSICLYSPQICFRVDPPSSSHQGLLASSGGVKVLFIGALQTPSQPKKLPVPRRVKQA